MKKFILHKAHTRGHVDHGWLNAYHTFSFSDYHDRDRMHFGALRVLNDDTIAGGMGFGMHPHNNMEIITIILSGALEHKDNMGHTQIIKEHDVQVMSAGKGVMHSEFNHHKNNPTNLLQIWVFPNKQNVDPRYDQRTFNPINRKNKLQPIISPYPSNESIWIYQNAWFYLSEMDKNCTLDYTVKQNGNGIYIFAIDGDISVNDQHLSKRDGIGVWNIETISAQSKNNAKILLMELPMN